MPHYRPDQTRRDSIGWLWTNGAQISCKAGDCTSILSAELLIDTHSGHSSMLPYVEGRQVGRYKAREPFEFEELAAGGHNFLRLSHSHRRRPAFAISQACELADQAPLLYSESISRSGESELSKFICLPQRYFTPFPETTISKLILRDPRHKLLTVKPPSTLGHTAPN